jgi:hypothetical protein
MAFLRMSDIIINLPGTPGGGAATEKIIDC